MNKMLLVLTFAFSNLAFARVGIFASHPASAFLQDTINRAEGVIAGNGSTSSKVRSLCAIFDSTVSSGYIGGIWLDQYRTISTDQDGVRAFVDLVPSIVMTKLFPSLGDSGTTFSVATSATERKANTYAVAIVIRTSGKTYNGNAIIRNINGSMKIIDGEYLGFSGVNYLKKDYQKLFNDAAKSNPQKPVSLAVTQIESESGFVSCP